MKMANKSVTSPKGFREMAMDGELSNGSDVDDPKSDNINELFNESR
jgi:hypothetical protein